MWIKHTSSSFWSKGLRRCWGISSLKPFCRARNCASIPLMNRQFTYNLEGRREKSGLMNWTALGVLQQTWEVLILQRTLFLINTFCIMKEVLIHSFFHQQWIIAPSTEKPKHHSELHLQHSCHLWLRSSHPKYFLSFTIYKNSVYCPLPTTFAGHISVCSTWHIPSCSLLSLEYSCHLVWVHAVKSSQRHCAPHRMYGPGLVWYHSLCQWTEGKFSIFGILVTLSGYADSYLNTWVFFRPNLSYNLHLHTRGVLPPSPTSVWFNQIWDIHLILTELRILDKPLYTEIHTHIFIYTPSARIWSAVTYLWSTEEITCSKQNHQ